MHPLALLSHTINATESMPRVYCHSLFAFLSQDQYLLLALVVSRDFASLRYNKTCSVVVLGKVVLPVH